MFKVNVAVFLTCVCCHYSIFQGLPGTLHDLNGDLLVSVSCENGVIAEK